LCVLSDGFQSHWLAASALLLAAAVSFRAFPVLVRGCYVASLVFWSCSTVALIFPMTQVCWGIGRQK